MVSHKKIRMLGFMSATSVLAAAAVAEVKPLFVMETAPLRAFAPDDLDAGLIRAIEMLPLRIEELPSEIPGFEQHYAAMASSMLRTASEPMRFAVVHDSDAANGPTMGYGLVMSVRTADEETALNMHNHLMAAIQQTGGPELRAHDAGFMMLEMPDAPPVLFGPQANGDDWHYELRLAYDGPSAGLIDAPVDGTVMRMSLDLRTLAPVFNMAKMQAENEGIDIAASLMSELENAGLAGENALRMNMEMGYTDDGSVTHARIDNLGAMWSAFSLPSGAISRSTFNLVPADAASAKFSRFDLEMMRTMVEKLDQYEVPASEYLDYFSQSTGIDLFADIIDPLGGDAVIYSSDSTGGGGFASSVVLMQIRDQERMAQTNQKLIDLTNMAAMMVPMAGRYIRIVPWEHDDMQMYSLRFPGMPIPFEPTFTYEGDWAIFASTPQAAVAACHQIRGHGDEGLGSVRAFTDHLPKGDLFSASFVDSDRVFRDGYGTVSMIGSGLSNLARSPWDRNRDPGLIVPPYNELKAAAVPLVSWAQWDGDALETTSVGSHSMLANLTVGLGRMGGGGAAFGIIQMFGAQMAQQQGFGMIPAPVQPHVLTKGASSIDAWLTPMGQLTLLIEATASEDE